MPKARTPKPFTITITPMGPLGTKVEVNAVQHIDLATGGKERKWEPGEIVAIKPSITPSGINVGYHVRLDRRRPRPKHGDYTIRVEVSGKDVRLPGA